jgi:lactate permease
MWQHNYEPVGGSLGLSAAVAAIPILVLFLMLGVWRKPAWIAAMAALLSALIVALAVYGMPVQLALISAVYGAAFGVFPIAWIVFASIMLYRLAVDTGKFEIIKDSIGGLTNDRRLQAMFIAFSFGAFIEGAAGFGAPVAISGAMLAGLGFNPFYAAGICLLANTAPVAFGSIGIPVTTLANVTGLPVLPLSAMVGRLCAMISIVIPGYLIVVMAGWKRAGEVLPAIIACGVSFAGMQYYVSNYMGPELTDILSSLTCIVVMVAVLKLWKPRTIMRLEGDKEVTAAARRYSPGEILMAWVPYLMLVVFVLIWGEPDVKAAINAWTDSLLPASIPQHATLPNLKFAILTIATMLGLAYVMNYSGMTSTLGLAMAASGVAFPFFSAVLGWLGVFLTGSDTSANALFGNLQVVTANQLGLNPVLTASVNSAAGVMGKMISIQSIAVAVAATGMTRADESRLFRFTIKHSILLMVAMAIISMLYAYVFPGYVPTVTP